MKEKEDRATAVIPPPANDNGPEHGAAQEAERPLDTIARAIATGIVNNELYAGVLVWNRLRCIKNPATEKRVSRVNPEPEWIRTEVPELRIVDEELWQAARRRQEEISKQFENVTKGLRADRARHVNELRRPAFLFSGLLKCGCCGGNYGIITRDRYGCLNRYRRGICDNGHTIRRDDIEQRILSGLTERLVSADRVAKAVRAYAEALNALVAKGVLALSASIDASYVKAHRSAHGGKRGRRRRPSGPRAAAKPPKSMR